MGGIATIGCGVDSGAGAVAERAQSALSSSDPADAVVAYVKASNTNSNDFFGQSVALSADSSTLVVGAYNEASAATGIDGNRRDNSAQGSGAVYVYRRKDTSWHRPVYIKASNTNTGDSFGYSVAVSADGSTLAVGASTESSAASGINGDQSDNSLSLSGAVYIFTRVDDTWTQQAYIKASNPDPGDVFGVVVALSDDGSTLAVSAPGESSAAKGIDGDQSDNSGRRSGAVYVFTRSGTTWSQKAYIKASNTDVDESFGASVALSGDATTLAVGSPFEPSAATGINGDQTSEFSPDIGAVYVFIRSGTTWSQEAYIKASNSGRGDFFGNRVAISNNGSTLAVGAPFESSAATGIGGDQSDDSAAQSGAVYLFTRDGTTWSQQAYIKASNTEAGDGFGDAVALSPSGAVLAVGAPFESSAASGIDGDQSDNSAAQAGAVYTFTRSGATWTQSAYVKPPNPGAGDWFGTSMSMSRNRTLGVGAIFESSAAKGIDGDSSDNSAPNAGAAYTFHRLVR
jgi:hypothetical protein